MLKKIIKAKRITQYFSLETLLIIASISTNSRRIIMEDFELAQWFDKISQNLSCRHRRPQKYDFFYASK